MYKSKTRFIVMTFIILFISFFAIKHEYAKSDDVTNNWDITITCDSEEINDTHKINFKVIENTNVVSGKFAPGMKAISMVEINLEKIQGKANIKAKVDKSKLSKVFLLSANLDDEIYQIGETKTVETGKKILLTFEIEWNSYDSVEDTLIGSLGEDITLPIEITITQVI